MYCRNCGTEIKEGNIYCTNCGTKILGTSAIPTTNKDYNPSNIRKFKISYVVAVILIIIILLSVVTIFDGMKSGPNITYESSNVSTLDKIENVKEENNDYPIITGKPYVSIDKDLTYYMTFYTDGTFKWLIADDVGFTDDIVTFGTYKIENDVVETTVKIGMFSTLKHQIIDKYHIGKYTLEGMEPLKENISTVKNITDTKQNINNSNLKVDNETKQTNQEVKTDTIQSKNIIDSLPRLMEIPKLVGLTEQQALEKIKGLDIYYKIIYREFKNEPDGIVIEQHADQNSANLSANGARVEYHDIKMSARWNIVYCC